MSDYESMTIRMSQETALQIRKIAWDLSSTPHEHVNSLGIKRTTYKRVTLGDVVKMALAALDRELAVEGQEIPETPADGLGGDPTPAEIEAEIARRESAAGEPPPES